MACRSTPSLFTQKEEDPQEESVESLVCKQWSLLSEQQQSFPGREQESAHDWMYGSLQVSSPSMYDITDSSECDRFSGDIVPKIAENRLGKHCHRSEESNDVSSFHEEDGLLTVGKNTAALDLLVSAAMQVSSGVSFGDDETFRFRKRVERGAIQAGLDRCAELFLLHGKLSPAKKKVKRLVQHSSKKYSNVGIHSGKGQKRRAPDEDGAPKKHVPDTVHAKDRCPGIQPKRRRFGVLPNNLPHSVIQTVQKVLRSEIPEVFPRNHFRRRKITKYCDEKYEGQERENKLKVEAAHAADMNEKEPVAQLKQCKIQGQPIKPTGGVLQSMQNVMRSGVASEIHFGRSNNIIPIDNRGEDQETENTSDMPFLETTAQNKYSSVQVQDVADVKEGDPLVRSKRGRCQVLPTKFSDSVLQPWKIKSRRCTGKSKTLDL